MSADDRAVLSGESLTLNVTAPQHKTLVDRMLPFYLAKPQHRILDTALLQPKSEKYVLSLDIDEKEEEFSVSFSFAKNA